jgi:PAS domain S-box-containing protein
MPLAPIRPKFRLRTTLVVPFVLQIAAAVGLISYLSFRNGQQAVADLAAQLSNQVSGRVSQQLNHYLATPRQANEMNWQAIELGMLEPQDFDTTGRFFWKQMQLSENLSYINFASPQGLFIGVGREDDGSLYTERIQPPDLDRYRRYALDEQGNPTTLLATEPYRFQEAEWYRSAVTAGQPIWSPIYQWSDRPEVIAISSSYPVYDSSKRLLGVLGVDLILSQISHFLQNLQITPSGRIFIIERDGMLVASSSPEKPYRIIDGKAERLNVSQSQESLKREAARQLRDRFGSFDRMTAPQLLSLKLDRGRAFVSVTPWQDALGLNWVVVVVIPESDLMGQIAANTRNTIGLCLAALGLAIAIGILTARWVTRPILKISQAATGMAQGNTEQHVDSSNLVEIDRLATAFNRMAAGMRNSFNALRQSEAHNQAILNAIPDLIVEVSASGIYLDLLAANDRQWLAIDREKRIGKQLQDVLPAHVAQTYLQAIGQVLQTGQPLTLEYEFQVGDAMQTFEARVAACRENSALFVVRNITERQQAEAALRQSLATNRALMDAIPDLLLRVSRDGTYLDDAVGANRLKGFSGGTPSLARTRVQDSLPPKPARQRMEAIERALQTGVLQVYEQQLAIDGKTIDEEVRVVAIGEDEVLVMVRDISDRKRAEEALRIAEENYRSIFENALEGIFQSSPEGRYININPAMAMIYGYDSPQEMIDTVTDIATQIYVDPEDRIEFKRQLAANDQVKDFNYRVYQKDGTIIWIEEDTRAVRDSNGQLLYYEGMIQDITDRKRREDDLRRQLEELKIEIDQQKREKEVARLTESSYFQEVQQEMDRVNLDEFWG